MTFKFFCKPSKMDHNDHDERPTPNTASPVSTNYGHRFPRCGVAAVSARGKHNRTLFLALAVTLAIAGCGTPRPPLFQAQATQHVNRDVSGAPLSVVVRAYQLSDRQAFDRLGLDSIAGGKPEADALGEQLLTLHEWVLTPGGSIETALPLAPHARYVGLIGFFVQPDAQRWRLLADATAIRRHGLRIEARDCHLVMTSPAPLDIPGQSADHQMDCGKPAPHTAASR